MSGMHALVLALVGNSVVLKARHFQSVGTAIRTASSRLQPLLAGLGQAVGRLLGAASARVRKLVGPDNRAAFRQKAAAFAGKAAGAAAGAGQAAADRVSALRANGLADESPVVRAGGPAFFVGLCVVIFALITSLATYLILTGLTPIQPTSAVVLQVLFIDLIVLAALIVVVLQQVWKLWQARSRQVAGARLHVQIVTLFSIIAVLPAIILAVFSSASLNRALDNLFSKGTETIIINSLNVANAYLEEHGQVIRSDIVAMANDVDSLEQLFWSKRSRFESELFKQAQLRNLPIAAILDSKGKVVVAAANINALPFLAPAQSVLDAAKGGEVVIVPPREDIDQVGAVKKLENYPEAFLYVSRVVNGDVIAQVRATKQYETEYRRMLVRRQGTQIAFGIMHLELALTLLLAAVWMGLWFANYLVSPIRNLISAAQTISRGDLEARVPVREGTGDLTYLSTTFNHMTSELKKQRDELVSTNNQLIERRRFIETVLSGVSAGVLGLDTEGRVDLVNRSASQLLGRAEADLMGQPLVAVIPEFASIYNSTTAQSRKDRAQEQVVLTIGGSERYFAVQLTREHAGDLDYGYVVTFDDITGLVTAQRTSAWADVARRIAHEIKNPLTPIQLSAERLRRKYSHVITEDREVFDRCTETIIRQVGDLGRMVDEFSSFARMPKAIMEPEDIGEVVRQAVILFQVGRTDIDFDVVTPATPVLMRCDRRLITQAVTNLVKNATEGIAAVKEQPNAAADFRGRIEAKVALGDGNVTIAITDNGCGLPKKDRQRLVEPYMTTRVKGTGIGLAVVHKVTEQHGGTLQLDDAPLNESRKHGAEVRMVLPLVLSRTETTTDSDIDMAEHHDGRIGRTARAGE